MYTIKDYVSNYGLLWISLANHGLFNWMSDELYLSIKYKILLGKKLNLNNPKTFNEKIQWLKLHDLKPIYTTMVDKCEAKAYVAKRIGEKYIIPTYGVWNDFDEIDFDSLPRQFVLKTTHDSGSVVVVRDRNTLDKKAVKKKIEKALKHNYFYSGREWPYKNVKPRIIAEKYLEQNDSINNMDNNSYSMNNQIIDYKFYCFDGSPLFLYVSSGLENHATAKISFVSLEYEEMPFCRKDYERFSIIPPKPKNFERMISISKELSKGMKFIRVDLYEINNQILFSELTFHPCSGFMPFNEEKYDEEIGSLIKL